MSDMSAIPPKVKSICELGILPGGGSLSVAKSYDSQPTVGVRLNCISKIEGIAVSLINPAKGGFTVAIEEKIGAEGSILAAALLRNGEKIQKKAAEIVAAMPFMAPMAATAARQAVLKEDPEFIGAIAEKIQATALFILDTEVTQDDTVSVDGSKEVIRRSVPKENIQQVLISKEIMNGSNDPRFTFVESTNMKINFCYKDEDDNPQTIKDIGPMKVPNYLDALTKIATDSSRGSLAKNPIYTHMTRL